MLDIKLTLITFFYGIRIPTSVLLFIEQGYREGYPHVHVVVRGVIFDCPFSSRCSSLFVLGLHEDKDLRELSVGGSMLSHIR